MPTDVRGVARKRHLLVNVRADVFVAFCFFVIYSEEIRASQVQELR